MEIKRPIDTKRKKIFRGRALWGLGAGASDGLDDGFGADWAEALGETGWDLSGAGLSVSLSAGLSLSLSADFSGLSCGAAFLTGTTGVCFLWIWPRTTAQAGGL